MSVGPSSWSKYGKLDERWTLVLLESAIWGMFMLFAVPVYSMMATWEFLDCVDIWGDGPSGDWEGGQTATVPSAVGGGIAIWLVACVGVILLRNVRLRVLLPILFALPLVYLVFLVGLWNLAPAIWGPLHCVYP